MYLHLGWKYLKFQIIISKINTEISEMKTVSENAIIRSYVEANS